MQHDQQVFVPRPVEGVPDQQNWTNFTRLWNQGPSWSTSTLNEYNPKDIAGTGNDPYMSVVTGGGYYFPVWCTAQPLIIMKEVEWSYLQIRASGWVEYTDQTQPPWIDMVIYSEITCANNLVIYHGLGNVRDHGGGSSGRTGGSDFQWNFERQLDRDPERNILIPAGRCSIRTWAIPGDTNIPLWRVHQGIITVQEVPPPTRLTAV
jgi:hypothetical protein